MINENATRAGERAAFFRARARAFLPELRADQVSRLERAPRSCEPRSRSSTNRRDGDYFISLPTSRGTSEISTSASSLLLDIIIYSSQLPNTRAASVPGLVHNSANGA